MQKMSKMTILWFLMWVWFRSRSGAGNVEIGGETTKCDTNFEIRAVLVGCNQKAVYGCPRRLVREISEEEDEQMASFGGEGGDEDNRVVCCQKKLVLMVKMTQCGLGLIGKRRYIIVSHVFDKDSNRKVRLLYPYVVKIAENEVTEEYPMRFQYLLNHEVKEKVLNGDTPGYHGCSTDPAKPTCPPVTYRGKPVPYSTGFCCSCDPSPSNANRFTEPPTASPDRNGDHRFITINYGDPKRSFKAIPMPDPGKRDTTGHGQRHIRGGQACNAQTDPTSAHCLVFSNLWYSAYALKQPKLHHKMRLEFYERHDDCYGNHHWGHLTQDNLKVKQPFTSTSNPKKTLAVAYKSEFLSGKLAVENWCSMRLLIPEKKNRSLCDMLLVDKSLVDGSGGRCDVIGVGYKAFHDQKDRCGKPKGTCLANQPKELIEADRAGYGQFVLASFPGVKSVDLVATRHGGQKLRMYSEVGLTATIRVEIKADFNEALVEGLYVKISEVYVSLSSNDMANLTVKVINSGLVASRFSVALCDCPKEIPSRFNNLHSVTVTVPPQKQHVFTIASQVPNAPSKFRCQIQAISARKILATRSILFRRADMCYCVWYCACACLAADGPAARCSYITLQEYNMAGYQGSLPHPTKLIQMTLLDELISFVFHLAFFCCLLLLLLGFIKGLLGCVSVPIGLWGFDVILDLPKPMLTYYESSLKGRKVVYNDQGWPVHPETGARVRNIAISAEFWINALFFFFYPFMICLLLLKRVCGGYSEPCCSGRECCCKSFS